MNIDVESLRGLSKFMQSRTSSGRMPGVHRTQVSERSGVERVASRPYVHGGDAKHIDWKRHAKTGELHVNRFKQSVQSAVHVVVDSNTRQQMQIGVSDYKKDTYMRELAAHMAWMTVLSQDPCTVYTPYGIIETGLTTGYNHAERIVSRLEQMQAVGTSLSLVNALGHVRNVRKGDLVIVISDGFDVSTPASNWAEMLRSIASRGADVQFVQCLDPLEQSSCFDDPAIAYHPNIQKVIRYRDNSGTRLRLNLCKPKGQAEYLSKLRSLTKSASEATKPCLHTVLVTDVPVLKNVEKLYLPTS